jgi:hypothetical protein
LRIAATSDVFAELKDPNHARLLSDLEHAQDFDIQLIAVNAANETSQWAPPAQSKRQKSRDVLRIHAIIYGPVAAYEAVGKYVAGFEFSLQDPLFCDRNVQYHNPHRLRREGQQVLYTHSIGVLQTSHSALEAEMRSCNLFALLEDQRNYAETDPPNAVTTKLYR